MTPDAPQATQEGRKAQWVEIGAAWLHKDGKGFTDDVNFRAGVLEAKEYADRGEFIE